MFPLPTFQVSGNSSPVFPQISPLYRPFIHSQIPFLYRPHNFYLIKLTTHGLGFMVNVHGQGRIYEVWPTFHSSPSCSPTFERQINSNSSLASDFQDFFPTKVERNGSLFIPAMHWYANDT